MALEAPGVERPDAWAVPAWDGSELRGKTVLLWAEQGLGDTVQFARYAPLVAARGGRVVVQCPACLASLVRSVEGVSAVFTQAEPLPECDVQAPFLSLPRLVGTAGNVPGEVPYMRADPERVARYRRMLGPARELRAGLVWRGNPEHPADRLRSVALSRLTAFGGVAGVEWHSLQVEEEARREALEHREWLRPCLEESPDADYLAAVVHCLDLVVSVDTMPAHLAGALGRPVWTLLAYVSDWRWQVAGNRSLWYPTVRLFRQPRLGDWEAVVERVTSELACWIQAFPAFTDKE